MTTKPRKPPLTHEGRWALDDIAREVAIVSSKLAGLSERSLKGLAFEAHRLGSQGVEALWRGVAYEAKRREAIRTAHRTGRGEWYAVVEVARVSRDHVHVFEELAVSHVKCSSREAAVEAGRKLMVEKAEGGRRRRGDQR